MRRILTFDHVSADGYFADAEGKLDWFGHDEEMAAESTKGMWESDGIFFGRRTYQMFAAFWPNAAEAPHGAPGSASMLEMARWLNETHKTVFSRTLKEATWRNTRLVSELDPSDIERLKHGPGKHIMVFGSGSIVSKLTEHGLIDEYQFLVRPIFLGGGRSLLSDVPQRTPLELIEARKFKSGAVLMRYAPAA